MTRPQPARPGGRRRRPLCRTAPAHRASSWPQASGLDRWEIGWQSAGRTPEPWLGPDILERLRALPGEGVRAVVVCPAGFTSDHLEVLYDLDVEARQLAEELGLAFARTESLNAEPRICAALAELVIDRTGSLER